MIKHTGRISQENYKKKVTRLINTIGTVFSVLVFCTPLIYVLFSYGYITPIADKPKAIKHGEISTDGYPLLDGVDYQYTSMRSATGAIMDLENDKPVCTAFLIGDYTMLTAAHCVSQYDWILEEYINEEEVYIKFSTIKNEEYYEVPFRVAYVPQDWMNPWNDYAILHTDKELGIMPYLLMDPDEILNEETFAPEVDIVGYPYVGIGVNAKTGPQTHLQTSVMTHAAPDILISDQCTKGQSGSALLMSIEPSSELSEHNLITNKQVIGIVSYGAADKEYYDRRLEAGYMTEEEHFAAMQTLDQCFAEKISNVLNDPDIPDGYLDWQPDSIN